MALSLVATARGTRTNFHSAVKALFQCGGFAECRNNTSVARFAGAPVPTAGVADDRPRWKRAIGEALTRPCSRGLQCGLLACEQRLLLLQARASRQARGGCRRPAVPAPTVAVELRQGDGIAGGGGRDIDDRARRRIADGTVLVTVARCRWRRH